MAGTKRKSRRGSLRAVIAIDGPAGSGKSTVAKLLAKKLGLRYLDTGSMYRAVTLYALESGISPTEGARLGSLAASLQFEMSDNGRVIVDGQDLTEALREKEIDRAVSEYSAVSEVRRELVKMQRRYASSGAVVEGRDIGTCVFPDAAVKVFLTASPEVRARRRLRVDKDRTFDEVLEDIIRRDRQDSTRQLSPLTPAEGVEVIDTSDLNASEVVDLIEARWYEATSKE